MRIEILDRLPAQYDSVVSRSPDASFYHTRVWLTALAASFTAWRLRCVVAIDGEDTLGVLPYFDISRGKLRRCWSLPMGSYGGPVLGEQGQIEARLMERFVETRRESGVHEVGLVDFRNRFSAPYMASHQAITHIIDLRPGFDRVWKKQFKPSKRSQARKAEREGVTVERAVSDDEAREFYAIYKQRTVEWGRFAYPESLFLDLLRNGGDSVRLFVARAGDRLLGGHLNFYFENAVIVWYGVATRDSRSTQASTMLYSSCIRDACEEGYTQYNLGASLDKVSLMDYKEALGGTAYSYRVHRWRSKTMRVATTVRRLLKRSGE